MSRLGALPGWTAAFSPDGNRLAYQAEDRIRVIDLADPAAAPRVVEIPAGARLAGKGAWSPDGRGLLVVSGRECDCGGYPMRWTVTTVPVAGSGTGSGTDPGTGSDTGSASGGAQTGPVYERTGAYALRVLGWWPSGAPIAAEYAAVGGTEPTDFRDEAGYDGLTYQDDIEAVRLVDLSTSRTVLDGGGPESIDVADEVLAGGATRPVRSRSSTWTRLSAGRSRCWAGRWWCGSRWVGGPWWSGSGDDKL